MISGRLAHTFSAVSFIVRSIVCIFNIVCKVKPPTPKGEYKVIHFYFFVAIIGIPLRLSLRRTLVRSVMLSSLFKRRFDRLCDQKSLYV
jgi:hypothetical protein